MTCLYMVGWALTEKQREYDIAATAACMPGRETDLELGFLRGTHS